MLHFLNNAIPTVGEIIGAKWGQEAFDVYTLYSDISIIVISLISAVVFAMHFGKRGCIFDKLVLKRDENGNEVAPLSVRERICGFFSKGMTLFTIYCILVALGLIYMSERM